MPTGLKRDLGLLSTSALAIGAMVGSGIFILPSVAYADAGPAAVVAFGIAGLLVLPAAISAAEMATAMPEDGGAYIYVERGMGPMLGTVAGLGTWLMLSLKGSLALVGGVPYIVVLAPTLAEYIVVMAVGLALFFTVVNIISAKGSGSVQFVIVGVMLLAMVYFIVGGIPDIDTTQTTGSFDITSDGLLAAIGAVFVSYAGVTKVTAVAEEVKNPGRNLPLAMVGSLLFTTALYVGIVYVAIGVADLTPGAGFVPEPGAAGDPAPIAAAAEVVFGQIGVIIIVIAALLALASTANAGLLAASRFPMAMARDGLVPSTLEQVSERFATPVNAIALTGGAMIVIVSIFDVGQVARFGSAFQILVFMLLNLALIGFREGAVDDYHPEFVSPLYPWLQIFGIVSGGVVLYQLGGVPFVGALGIAGLSLVWYYIYARPRIEREGAARAGVRQNISDRAIERARELFAEGRRHDVLVAITEQTSELARRDMTRIGLDLSRLRVGSVTVGHFESVPHHVFTQRGPDVSRAPLPEWLQFDDGPPEWYGGDGLRPSGGQVVDPADRPDHVQAVDYREIESEHIGEAIVEYVAYEDFGFVVLERRREEMHSRFREGITTHVLKNADCGVLIVEDRGFTGADEIAVVATRGLYDPVKLLVADAIAEETGATITLMQAVSASAADSRRETIEEYHSELVRLLTVPAQSRVLETDDAVSGLARFTESADLLVTGTETRGVSGDIFGRPGDELVDSVECTAIMVQPADEHRPGLVQRYLLSKLFGLSP